MSRRAPSARLFVAVDPPEQVAAQLAAWARTAARERRSGGGAQQQALRVLEPELLHVTVCFLGNRPVEEIQSLTDELSACDRPAVRLSVGAPLWLPPRRPRALAVELHDKDGTLARIHAEVTSRLETADQTPLDQTRERHGASAKPRRFHPHITVARMRADGRGRRPRGPSGEHGESLLPPTPSLSFVPAELVLYRSWLSPQGAGYEPLSALPLG
jgi:RNA 2',3'-cyclic 3'-phosphodiesterase